MLQIIPRILGTAGLGNPEALRSSLGDQWFDCDKARIVGPAQDTYRAWPGYARQGRNFLDTSRFGAAGNRIDIMRASQDYIRKSAGHLLVAVDRNSNTAGRILGMAHHNGRGALLGTEIVGVPVQTTGSGLDDLSSGGVYTSTVERTYHVEIDDAGTPDSFRWSNDNGATFVASSVNITGAAQTLENGLTITFAATTGHTNTNVWKFTVGGRPQFAVSMNRIHPHTYVQFAAASEKTAIIQAFDEVLIDDGTNNIRPTLRAPHIKPNVYNGDQIEGTFTPFDIGDTNNATIQWSALTGGGITVTRRTSAPVPPGPPAQTAYVRIRQDEDQRFFIGNLAHLTSIISVSINNSVKTVSMWIRSRHRRGRIKPNTYSLQLASSAITASVAATIEIKIPIALRPFRWQKVALNIPDASDLSNDLEDVGIRRNRAIPRRYFNSSGDLDLEIAGIVLDTDTGSGTSKTSSGEAFESEGEWRFGFTWLNSETGEESAMSPWSDPVTLDAGAVTIDITGFEPGIATGLANSAPDGVDRIIVYVSNDEWGKDPRFGPGELAGGFSFHQLSPADGDEISGLRSGSNSETFIDFTEEGEIGLLNAQSQRRQPFYNSHVIGGNVVVAHGDLIVTADEPEVAVFTWDVTADSHVVAAATNASRLGPWLEGREWQRTGDEDRYRIVKVIDTSGNGNLDSIWIARDFDAETQQYMSPYGGTTGTGVAGRILGSQRKIRWTNDSETFGVDPGSMSILNQLEVMPAGDGIVGAFPVDEFLYVLGSENIFIFQQNPSALADLPADTGAAYSNPVHIRGSGMAGPRCWAPTRSQAVVYLSARGELMIVTPGAQPIPHPVSDRVAGILGGFGMLVDTRFLRRSFMLYRGTPEVEEIFIGLISGVDTATLTQDGNSNETTYDPGVVIKQNDTYAFTGSGGTAINELPLNYDGTNAASPDCVNDGASVDTAALAQDFHWGILIDLKNQRVTVGSRCPFTCSGIGLSSSCTAAGQLTGQVWAGDRHGYVDLVLEERLLGWGAPESLMDFAGDDDNLGGNLTFQIDPDVPPSGATYTVALPRDGDNNGLLDGLLCAKVTPSTDVVEFREIASHTNLVVTIVTGHPWDTNQVAGDQLIIGALAWMVHWAERRTTRGHMVRDMTMDYFRDESESSTAVTVDVDPRFRADIFSANGTRSFVNIDGDPAVTKRFSATDLRTGPGTQDFAADDSKAHSLRLTAVSGQIGPMMIANPRMSERLEDGEQ